MSERGIQQQAQEWFERGKRDFETAQLLYDQGGYTEAIAYHIQQAIEKYLTGMWGRGQFPGPAGRIGPQRAAGRD